MSAADPSLIASVVEEITTDALLRWRSGNIAAGRPLSEPVPVRPGRGRSAIKRAGRKPLWAGMLAAAALITVGVGAWLLTDSAPGELLVADIIDQEGVRWGDDTTALSDDDAVGLGRLSSSGGEYTLQFRDGSTVRVVGRASLEIKSKMLVRLDHGRATAQVPPNSIGFTIESSLIDVVDLGTEFGISVDGDHADVVVFDGEVDVKSNLDQASGQRRLTQGNAVKVARDGAMGRLVDVGRDVDGRWWTGNRLGADGPLIARVTDNIGGSSEVYAFYQTTYQGLSDDAVAYTDNPNHQWNGLTPDGLPGFLRGADYVRTFNHYRYLLEFQMKIELSAPANLFVFADNRIPPPEWLVEQFRDTGIDIGLDEGPWLDNIPEEYRKFDVNTTAVGAGQSVDNTFSVWRRRCTDTTPITLGSAGLWSGDEGHGRAMYGVAATPLDAPAPDGEQNSPVTGSSSGARQK
ncbi:FecR domain-containing protein [Pirellulimonas nuda]|nr:FecR family protein [Pirellulimonas nuda]